MEDVQVPDSFNTGAVIVTYHPDPELPQRVSVVADQVARVLIVDNNSDTEAVDMLRKMSERDNVELALNGANLGVATALNQGLSWARERGYEWLLTMDQDSRLFEGAISKYRRVYKELKDPGDVALIGSNFLNRLSGRPNYRRSEDDGLAWEEVTTVITSGTLMSVWLTRTIGRFRDDLFIDHVDCEYCLRAGAKGFRTIRVREPLFEHVIGAPFKRRCLWRTRSLSNVPPQRWYYQARNLVALAREYRTTQRDWVRRTVRIRLKDARRAILYEPSKIAKFLAISRGVLDGLRGKMGPMA